MIHIITPCSRPENLATIKATIPEDCSWLVVVDEKELQNELLSDQIAYKILDEEADLHILKVAEKKVSYIKTKRNAD